MKNRAYSKNIADAINSFLTEDKWHFSFDDQRGLFKFGLKNGNFKLDMRDGEIRYKSFVDREGLTPTMEMVGNSIHCPAAMFDRYSSGIVDNYLRQLHSESGHCKM